MDSLYVWAHGGILRTSSDIYRGIGGTYHVR